MKLSIGHGLKISGLSDQQRLLIQKLLSIKNPTYDVMKRQGNIKALYAIKEYIKYFHYDAYNNCLSTGRGVFNTVIKMFGPDGKPIEIERNICSDVMAEPLRKNTFTLREYQEGAIEEILGNLNGIIKLDTGWGKTLCALKLIEQTTLKTLIIVPRLSILAQFVQDLKKYYDYEPGVINGKTFEVKDITVATVQTLKKRDLSEIKDKFGMVIFDECHTYISEQGMRIINTFNPMRLYGMSASPDRSDGQGEAIKFYFGDIIIDRRLPQETPKVEIIRCVEKYFGDTYADIINKQVENQNRNNLLVMLIRNEISKGRRVLVLTKRVSHYELLERYLSDKKCHKICSGLSAAEQCRQDNTLEELRCGSTDFDAILGTFSMLSTGVNIPALDTLILAGDLRSNILTTQSVGRILRIFEGKQSPKIIDIDDVGSGILHNQSRLRKRFYKENNWEII